MSVIIGAHPEVESVGEIKSWPHYKGLPRDYDSKNEDFTFWNNVLNQYETETGKRCNFDKLEQICNNIELCKSIRSFSKLTSLITNKTTPEALQQYYEHNSNLLGAIQKVSGKKIILDSSKSVCRAIALLKQPNVNMKAIHLIRDPRGTVWSFMKKDVEQKPKDTMRALFDYFVLNATSTLVRHMFRNRVMKVKYEELVRQPAETIGKIFDFIGLDESIVLSMIKNDAEFEVQHLFDGNRVRKNNTIKFRADEEWKKKLPRIYKILCTILARPLYFL
ncbi:MAG: sulfotransferase domain-containing protein [Desulfobacteraceae bacterium]|nr:sulfotransferase domain-containing protein [Desulfobacteraceae bacterium]